MKNASRIGQLVKCAAVGGEAYSAYIPAPLPPQPALDVESLYALLDQAGAAIGRLDGMSLVLPDPSMFLYMYIRKEAVLSSQIEGTQSSLSDLLLFETTEAPGAPFDDVTEVSSYVAAMNYGLARLKEFPLSLRLIREIHAELMNNARGGHRQPGEFRTSQNWIGGARPGLAAFVPPPPERLMECLDPFEKFLHDDRIKLPVLVKAALAHVQFETIHPFLDGNGRLGRLLITFILCANGVLREPLLYLSLYFKANRQTYYSLLQSVRETGDWESWVEFFLTGVIETSNQAAETARAIIGLFERDRKTMEASGKTTASVLSLHTYLQRQPVCTASSIRNAIGASHPTVMRSLTALDDLGIIREVTGKERRRVFVYQEYLDILNRGAESLAH
jgi:Fic family protein